MRQGTDVHRSLSMLLVEDDQLTRELVESILNTKFPDLEIYASSKAETGLQQFDAHRPDIVLTDISLPGMSGIEMAEKILEMDSNTKLIAITANMGKLVLHGAGGTVSEFHHVILKPVKFRELFAAIQQCIGDITRQA